MHLFHRHTIFIYALKIKGFRMRHSMCTLFPSDAALAPWCLTLLQPFLNISIHSQTLCCSTTLFPLCTDILLYILAPGSLSAHTKCSLFAALLSCKWKVGCPSLWHDTYDSNGWSRSDHQNIVEGGSERERETICIALFPTSSAANRKKCTCIADNYWLTFIKLFLSCNFYLASRWNWFFGRTFFFSIISVVLSRNVSKSLSWEF